ncbi:RNA-binding transcriptional accessory protein [Alcanivorax sp. JB21]|nr:RNA-binding transcriptional accessory protein [Alcanivorax limicola]
MSEPRKPSSSQNPAPRLTIEQIIAAELNVQPRQVAATVALLDDGATVPFIARYRKEATDGLDDTQLRNLEERLRYLRELVERRDAILKSIREQDKLTPTLEADILAADTKTRLEDLYLPYKQKRRTRAQTAREAGLEPLADSLLADPGKDPETEAAAFLNPELKVETVKDALDGAKQILMERFSENAELLTRLRTYLWEKAQIIANVVEGKDKEGIKFSDYFAHREPLAEIPSHRALALFRGRNEGVLHVSMSLPEDLEATQPHPCEAMVAHSVGWQHQQRPADNWLGETLRWTWKIKLNTHLETELLGRVREMAEEEAIQVFARNLRSLLLSSPAGPRTTMGLDPGLRTGVKVVVVDATGKLLEHATIFPHQPRNQWDQSMAALGALCVKHQVSLIAIGNGTASRETDKLAGELVKKLPKLGMSKIMVSEAGASVYSASELAAREFPDLDVSFRGAVSIARRLQDPLAELVKIDPKSIGVGQYQHDVSQVKLARGLDAVVEDCVNAVGVDVNTASAPLLARISGLNATIAGNIVSYREKHGAFANRDALKQVPRLGEKTFEQAAGFLRISQSDNPLDASSVHPEAYSLVERIAATHSRVVQDLMGDAAFLRKLKPADLTDERFGVLTVTDILAELEKPGRDPRPEFKAAEFMEGVEDIKDLKPGMVLEGTVTNVTNFGAFVDVGVHQDGLVHVSALSDKFVKDAHDVVSPGDIVKVKVMEVDLDRRRISMTMRLEDRPEDRAAERGPSAAPGANRGQRKGRSGAPQRGNSAAKPEKSQGTFADLFAKAQQEKDARKRKV